jgi:hypothetical protein
MKKNIGPGDRMLRFILGVVLLLLVFTGPQTNWGWLGLVPLVTSMVGYCPLYAIFGWTTRKPAHV